MISTKLLGVSGEEGSFSEEAGRIYAQKTGIQTTLEFLVDMEGVLSAVSDSRVDLGIFPVVNCRGGLVLMAFEAMGKYLFTFIDQFTLNVKQCLMVRPGVALSQVENVVSHPQGFAQCELYLQKEHKYAKRIMWEDTAKAARDLASGVLSSTSAVIASKRAAQIYGFGVCQQSCRLKN